MSLAFDSALTSEPLACGLRDTLPVGLFLLCVKVFILSLKLAEPSMNAGSANLCEISHASLRLLEHTESRMNRLALETHLAATGRA